LNQDYENPVTEEPGLTSTAVEERTLERPISVRVSPHSYFAALFIGAFLSGFLIYIELDLAAAIVLSAAFVVLPILAIFDRVSFDGRRLRRGGLIPRVWVRLTGGRDRLKLNDIEQVETHAVRTLKRGGRVFYRYRTSFRGKGIALTVASGGDYRKFVLAVLPRLSENVLDNRSIEMRDYLTEPSEAIRLANESRIPPGDVLDSSLKQYLSRNPQSNTISPLPGAPDAAEKVSNLRSLANQLRLSGSLSRSLEAFRRAVIISPSDGWLLFEFARCLQSYAGSERDERLGRRAVAMMRLAERRAGNDAALLSRLGENYFQIGDWRRAGKAFQKALESVGDRFRSLRGLAEIALREGKIAHVIHNFAAANESTDLPALRRWTDGEIEYFSRLNEDDEYMELEVSRVNLLDSLDRSKRTSLKIALLGSPLVIVGILTENSLISNIGWAVSFVAIAFWVGIMLFRKMLEPRIPFEIVNKD
jgi:tetratricopeptide (TPR) repeat protein